MDQTVKEKRAKKLCLDLSLERAKKIRDLNKRNDPSLPTMPNQFEWKNFPSFGQGVMVPDKGFTKQLHTLDPEYEVAWDWGSSKWEIWKFPKDGTEAYHILTVETKGKTYRELGADVLLRLQQGNSNRFSPGQLAKYLEELDNQHRRKRAESFRQRVKDIALDSFLNIHCMKIQVPQQYSIARASHV